MGKSDLLKEGLKGASLSTVSNAIDISLRKHSYGYGYGKKYGYGYGKRYGYGYGDTESSKK